MPIRRSQKKRNAEPRQKQNHRRLVIDTMVNPGSSAHRHQARSKADPARPHHRMVTLAQSSPGDRSACAPQSKTATVMLGAVHLAVAGSIGCGIVLLATLYRPPADSTGTSVTTTLRLDRNAAIAVIAAGLIWGMFNVGFAMIVSFGPSMLVDRCGRIDDQHRVVGLGRVRSLGRFSGCSHQASAELYRRQLHRVRVIECFA